MPLFRFIHCADLHIDSPLRGLDQGAPAEKIRMATREAFTRLVTYAIGQRVNFVLAAGDLFDGDGKDWRTGHFLVQEVARLHREEIHFVGVRGNHDAESILLQKDLPFPGRARLLSHKAVDPYRIDDLDVVIHGQSFATRNVSADLSRSYPDPEPGKFNIGLLHTNMDGTEGHDDYAPSSSTYLANRGYQYWALGHIHERRMIGPGPGNAWIVYPGNLQARHIGETGAKGAVLVTVTDGVIASPPEFIPFDTVRFARVTPDLGAAADLDAALSIVRAHLQAALDAAEGRLLAVRVELTGPSPAYAGLVRDAAETRERIRADAQSIAGPDALWIEDVKIRLTPPPAQEPLHPALAAALDAEPPADLHDAAIAYGKDLLDRVGGLRAALGPDHPVVKAIEDGSVPPELLDRARTLLRARAAG
jgi:DNA repair exonuclease SbcCD nuclease subunit